MTKIELYRGPMMPASPVTRRDCAKLGHDFRPLGNTGLQVCKEPECRVIERDPNLDQKVRAACGCEIRESQLKMLKVVSCAHYPEGLEVEVWLQGSRLCI